MDMERIPIYTSNSFWEGINTLQKIKIEIAFVGQLKLHCLNADKEELEYKIL